ncbi:hypothetical protein A4X06_0g9137 [Tilletia controversa]|uniref:Uncharacterized protein n=3 Tax=Tilletia TaxID=13289 RepID=A0A8X7SSJ2_9BASI|nr:hypothetical protein A4X06_0g9137 [Tilletia controversa]
MASLQHGVNEKLDERLKPEIRPLLVSEETSSTLANVPALPSQKQGLHVPYGAFLLALLYACCISAPIVALAYYLYKLNRTALDPSNSLYLLTTAPATRVLAITQTGSTAMKLLMGPSMTILAWYVAGQWIRGSERSQLRHGPSVLSENPQAKKRRPTPAQFAILQNIFISTGITALLDAVTYSFRLTGTTKKLRKTKVPSPSYFRLSVAVFAILLVLNYACMLLDTALHFTTRQAVAGLPVQPQDLIYPGSTKEFGRSLNTSKAMMDIYVAGLQPPRAPDSSHSIQYVSFESHGLDRSSIDTPGCTYQSSLLLHGLFDRNSGYMSEHFKRVRLP